MIYDICVRQHQFTTYYSFLRFVFSALAGSFGIFPVAVLSHSADGTIHQGRGAFILELRENETMKLKTVSRLLSKFMRWFLNLKTAKNLYGKSKRKDLLHAV